MAGETQDQADKVKDTVEGGLDKVQHALNEVPDKAKQAVHRK